MLHADPVDAVAVADADEPFAHVTRTLLRNEPEVAHALTCAVVTVVTGGAALSRNARFVRLDQLLADPVEAVQALDADVSRKVAIFFLPHELLAETTNAGATQADIVPATGAARQDEFTTEHSSTDSIQAFGAVRAILILATRILAVGHKAVNRVPWKVTLQTSMVQTLVAVAALLLGFRVPPIAVHGVAVLVLLSAHP